MLTTDPATILVVFIIITFVSFVIYVAVEGRKEEQRSKVNGVKDPKQGK